MRLHLSIALLLTLPVCPSVRGQAPAPAPLDECLGQASVLKTYEILGEGGEDKVQELGQLDHQAAVIMVQACGAGGGGGASGSGGNYAGGGGGGSAPVVNVVLRCGSNVPTMYRGGGPRLDCSKPVKIVVPGLTPGGADGRPVRLSGSGPDGQAFTVELAPGGSAGQARASGFGYRAGGDGATSVPQQDGPSISVPARPGAPSGFWPGGAASNGSGGGGGASELAAGGAGGQDAGRCAGGGGANWNPNGAAGAHGGPGYAYVTVLSLKEAARCGQSDVYRNIGSEIKRLYKEEREAAPPPAPQASKPQSK